MWACFLKNEFEVFAKFGNSKLILKKKAVVLSKLLGQVKVDSSLQRSLKPIKKHMTFNIFLQYLIHHNKMELPNERIECSELVPKHVE